MVMLRSLNQFLKHVDGYCYYFRRVPKIYAEVDDRLFSKASLKTVSLEVARVRRDAMVEADDEYWASLLASENASQPGSFSPVRGRYNAAKKRALARGFIYSPANELAGTAAIEELFARIVQVKSTPKTEKADVEALLGGVEPTHVLLSDAFDLYCDQLALDDQLEMSDEQKASWKKVKTRAVKNFIGVCGDLNMDEITRKHAQKFRQWWGDRVKSKDPKKRVHPNTANRDIGNMRSLYLAYWDHEGELDRPNPFDKMRFNNVVYKDIPPFEDEWVRDRFLVRGAFGGLNIEAVLIFLSLIETGCRPSEIANIEPEQIILNHEVPHLRIRPREEGNRKSNAPLLDEKGNEIVPIIEQAGERRKQKRKLKSRSSARDIPLLGVSLEAMKRAPNGFPKYRNKGNTLSATLLKCFRTHGLFPTENHRIYSVRHSLEKRMLEADLDYGLRCLLMGHHDRRPQYGDGGSLEFRRDQLAKIAHPFPENLFDEIDAKLATQAKGVVS